MPLINLNILILYSLKELFCPLLIALRGFYIPWWYALLFDCHLHKMFLFYLLKQSNKSTWKSSKRNNSEDLFHWNGCNESICESFRRSVYLEVSCWFTFSLFCFLRLLLAWKSFSYLGYSRNPNQQMKEKILLRRMLVKREDQVQT